jgi:hypothetical protein
VPEGNQHFLTENNTCGHYQDNVAQYFIGHPQSLVNAGLVAVLFGAGNGCQTNNWDLRGDGVTNNNGQTTTDLLGYCNACNTSTSVYADDDGGYLRIFVGQYYAASSPPARTPVTQSAGNPPGSRDANQSSSPPTPAPRIAQVPAGTQKAASNDISAAWLQGLQSLQLLDEWLLRHFAPATTP